MKVYAISGLGADKRVFQYLKLNCELIYLDWIEPKRNETIEAYSLRLSEKIDTNDEFGILGLSFGGLVAVEISKKLNPKLTILISSVETSNELRFIYRIAGKLKLFNFIPSMFFDPPRTIAYWLFGAKQKSLLNEILNDTDLKFAKWAILQLLNWKNNEKLNTPIWKINGTKDKLIPPIKKDNNIKLIEQGTHFMVVDSAKEVSSLINDALKEIVKV